MSTSTVPISARVSLDENRAIEAFCSSRGVRKGDLIREAVLKAVREPPAPRAPAPIADPAPPPVQVATDPAPHRDPPAPAAPVLRLPPMPPPSGGEVVRFVERRKPLGTRVPSTQPVNGPQKPAAARGPSRTYSWTCPRCRAVIAGCTDELREAHYLTGACPAVNSPEPGVRVASST